MIRLDAAIKPSKMEWKKDSKGCYRAIATLGIAELPLTYHTPQFTKRVETITADSLFDEESLESAFGLPMCLGHPKELYYNRNAEQRLVGSLLQEYIREGDTLYMPCVVTDSRAIEILDKYLNTEYQVELSPGYTLPKGTRARNDGEIYEQVQRIYDHIAIIPPGQGRGGQNLTIRTDSLVSDKLIIDLGENKKMKKSLVIDSVSYEIEDSSLFDKLSNILKDNTKLTADSLLKDKSAETLQSRIDTLQAEYDGLKSKFDTLSGEHDALVLKSANKEADKPNLDALETEIQARLDTWMVVTPSFVADDKDFTPNYKLTPSQIKAEYIKKFHPTINIDSKSDEYINGLWEGLKPEGKQIDLPFNHTRNQSNFDALNTSYGINKEKPKSVSRIESNGKMQK